MTVQSNRANSMSCTVFFSKLPCSCTNAPIVAGPPSLLLGVIFLCLSWVAPSLSAQEYSVPTLEHMSEHPLECMNGTVFSTFIDVFGVYLVATPEAPKAYVDHSANVLAEYLDNDGDGVPDDKAVSDYLADGNYIMPVWEEEDREAFFEGVRGTYCEDNVGTAASMYYLEDQWAIGGLDVAGQWDVNLEEIWHVVSKGWYAVYPDEFGDEWEQEGFTSKLMEAMDVARGGKFLSPPEQYPTGSWYNYYDESCDYGCQLHEYFYWGVVANMGALEKVPSKCGPSSDSREWTLCTRDQLQQTDTLMFALLNEGGFSLPTEVPDGNYRGLNPIGGNDDDDSAGEPLPEVRVQLEEPVEGEIHTGVGNLRGWAVADLGIEKVEIWIDDEYAFDVPYGGSRGDVGSAFPDIAGSRESGFSMAFAYSALMAGDHTAKAVAYDSNGSMKESPISFSVVKFEESFIADPNAVDLSNASCSVSGDEVSVTDAVVSGDPLDMLLKWRTAEQGFEIIEIHGSGAGVAMFQQRQAMPANDALADTEGASATLRVTLEEPVNGEIHSGVGNLRGWAVASEGIEKIEIYIDGNYAFDAPYGGARGDVGAAFPDVANSTESGFSLAYTYSNLAPGTHAIEAVARAADGETDRSAATFEVVKFAQSFISDPQAVNLDAASCATEGDEISITGAVVAGETYDLVLDWRTAEQGFEIVEVK